MSPRSRVAAALASFSLAAALVIPSVAVAATAPPANGNLDLQTWSEGGAVIVVTAITIPESTKLPTVVRVPVPEGAQVQWAGEVLGGDLSQDPARPYKIVKSPVGGQYAEFTVETTRSAQVDSQVGTVTVNGPTTSATFEWVQSVAAPLTSFAVRTPGNVDNVQIVPTPSGAPERNQAGERLYSTEPAPMAPGTKQPVGFSYTLSSGTAASGGSSSTNTLLIVVIVALVAVAGVLVYMVSRKKPAAADEDADAYGDDESASGDDAAGDAPESDDDWGFTDSE